MADAIIVNVHQLLDKAPPEIKEAAPYLITCATQVATTSSIYEVDLNPMKRICGILKHNICLSPVDANELLNNCSSECVTQNHDGLFQAFINPGQQSNDSVIQQLRNSMQSIANGLLIANAVTSYVFIVTEIIRLWNVWDRIKDARNLVASSQKKKQHITSSLNAIQHEIKVLNSNIEELTQTKNSEYLRVKTMRQIDNLKTMLGELKQDIGSLRVKIDNTQSTLRLDMTQSKVSAITNVFGGISTIIHLNLLSSIACPWLIAINSVALAANIVVVAANIGLLCITKADLKIIQNEIKEIDKLDMQWKDIQADFQNKSEQIWDLIEYQSKDYVHKNLN